mgnify:CR=1 FL=1
MLSRLWYKRYWKHRVLELYKEIFFLILLLLRSQVKEPVIEERKPSAILNYITDGLFVQKRKNTTVTIHTECVQKCSKSRARASRHD